MKTAVLQVRLDADLKTQADAFFKRIGLDTNSATRLFYKQCLLQRCLPFKVVDDEENNPFYNAANQRAIEESLALSKAEKVAGREFSDADEDDDDDDFYSESNQKAIREAIADVEAGKIQIHELIEVEDDDEEDEENDPFYSEANQREIKEALARVQAGKGSFRELIKV